jgi:hypothetical protein
MARPVHVVLWTVAALSPVLAVFGAPVGALGLALGLVVVVMLARRSEPEGRTAAEPGPP